MLSSVVLNVIIFIARDVNLFYSNLFKQTSDIFQPNIVNFREAACAIESFYLDKVPILTLVLLSRVGMCRIDPSDEASGGLLCTWFK